MPKKNIGHKLPSERQLKAGETLKRIISEGFNIDKILFSVLGDISITVTEVRISPDLKNATIYVLPFAEIDKKLFIESLDENVNYIKTYLAKNSYMKFLPNLLFKYDESFDQVKKIDDILLDINE